MLWENLREEEFDDAVKESNKLCVIPIGCTEMHGEHLPVGTDTITSTYIAQEAAKLEPVCVFPSICFGNIPFLTNWKGSIRLSVELMQQFLTEICSEIARNGFKKILILNGHGGNPPLLYNFVSSTQHTKKDYVVMCRNEFCYEAEDLVKDLDNGEEFPELTDADKAYLGDFVRNKYQTGHACINETSVILAIKPELVRMDRAGVVDGVSTGKTDYLKGTGILNGSARFWNVEQPNHFRGEHLEGVNERIGRVFLRKRIEAQAEACRLLKQDDRILDWNEEWNNAW